MRICRPCYDKPWRCPGWARGGMRFAKRDRCDDGRMRGWYGDQRWPHLRFHRCDKCRVITLPFVLRWLSPFFLVGKIRVAWRYREVRR